MKKIALLFILTAGLSQAKAQQTQLPAKPNLQLNDGLSQNTFKPNISLTPQQMLLQPQKSNALNGSSINGESFFSTMPVVKIASTDHMPILVLGQPGIKYTMLIKKINIIDPNEPVEKPLMP